MRFLSWAAGSFGLFSSTVLAQNPDSDTEAQLCAPFKDYKNVCLWYRSENVVFVCKTGRFIPTEGTDLVILQANGAIQKLCTYWSERPSTVLNDPLLDESSSSSDDDDDKASNGTSKQDDKASHARHMRSAPDFATSGPTAMKGKPWIPLDTRCNPVNNTQVQVFRHGWYPAYDCPSEHSCVDIGRTNMSGRAGCNNVDGTYDIPDPHNWEPDFPKRDLPSAGPYLESSLQFDSRCAPGETNIIQRPNGTSWTGVWTCARGESCVNLHGIGACDKGNGLFFIPAAMKPLQMHSRETAPEKMMHSWDTRCNPRNGSEVQRFNGNEWILHAVCMLPDGCRDVNGIGACWLGMHHYDLPAANDTINPHDPLPPAPILLKKKCDPSNNRQVLGWTMKGWALAGYCIAPYICEDFTNAGFAICVNFNGATNNRAIWQPWSQWNGVTSINGTDIATVRCKSRDELVRLSGDAWVHDSYCTHGWVCRNDVTAPHMGGCYALWLAALDVYQDFLAASQGMEARDTQSVAEPVVGGPGDHGYESGSQSSDSEFEIPPNGVDNLPPLSRAPKFKGMHERRMHNQYPHPPPLF